MSLRPAADLNAVLRAGLGKSVVSLLIKVATAGLTYVMYVALARAMGATEYGYFAFGLSVATVLSIAASIGQQTAILRYWPEAVVAGDEPRAQRALRAGGALVVLAGIAIALALVGFALLASPFVPVAHLVAAAALVLPLALAEYFSSALRAQGSVWTALVPRDIVWRAAVPAAVIGLAALGLRLDGWQALLLSAMVLVLALAVQAAWAGRRAYLLLPRLDGLGAYWRDHGRASRWFLIGTLIDAAALNVDVILVGLFVAPESAGVYFNAFRTAGLLTLFMFAITLVVAPMVARHYHAGEMRKAQAVTALCAWAGFAFSLVVFVGFALFGRDILSLFGAGYAEEGYLILMLLSVGLLVDAATGPSRIVLMMTGHERAYVTLFGGIMVAGMVLQVLLIPVFGMVGAAVINMSARIAAQLAIAIWARRSVGLDTSLFGVLFVRGMVDRPAPPSLTPGAATH